MDGYQKNIRLKTLWISIIKRFRLIALIFVPVALATIIVTEVVLKKTYKSEATIANTANLSLAQYNTIQFNTTKDDSINRVVNNLSVEKKIVHKNGTQFSFEEIKNGIIVSSFVSNSPFVTISFQSTDNTVVQPVLSEIVDVAIYEIKNAPGGLSSIYISSPSTAAQKSSNESKYLIIGLVAGAVLALGMAFIDEIISDEVYDSDDIRYLGSPAFEITASK